MNSVTQFTHYLLRLDPQKTPARLCLFNYLKHILEPTEPFTPAIIENFYLRALGFDYWQNNSSTLADAVREDLEVFLKQNKVEGEEWHKIRHADQMQTVSLKNLGDFEEIVVASESSRRKSGDRLKLIKLSETEVASLFMTAIGTLEVKVFSPRAVIKGNSLSPLAPTGHLHYSGNMELMPHVRQLVQGNMMTTISFFQDENGLHGMVTRGHTFQKFETFLRARANDNHDLFCSLKRIERAYINPQSDPYYQDMVQAMERANRSLQSPNARGLNLQMAEKALQKGSMALRNAFPNDRLLQLLVTHLEYGIRQARQSNSEATRSAE